MTTGRQTERLHPMSVHSAIRFRDPFVVSKNLSPSSKGSLESNDQSTPNWTTSCSSQAYLRPALTPPPEMSGVHAQATPGYQRDHGHHYGDRLPSQQAYRAPVAPYLPQELPNFGVGRHTEAHSRSPPVRLAPVLDSSSSAHGQRRGSQPNAIASNFQIPRSVNDTGGSLSELAAQITCLFWFESSELLEQVEDSPSLLQPTRPLSRDAKPTTGFRKWVTTILSTTQVAQNVVVLALLFIYRLKKLNPAVKGKPGSEYRLLTVALMLGNKFLDDNTYTNKTWAEVSGINVGEVHIMEVEFLSNMKYDLYTSDQDWSRWQKLLGDYARFFDQASKFQPPRPPQPPAPILPPSSSLHLPPALPSPPVSNQASPPYVSEQTQFPPMYSKVGQHGPSPATSPLGTGSDTQGVTGYLTPRKRSRDDHAPEMPSKRIATGYHTHTSPQRYSSVHTNPVHSQSVPSLALPGLPTPSSQASFNGSNQPQHSQQLPPLTVPARAMAAVYPTPSSQSHIPPVTASASAPHQPISLVQHGSRQQSPFAISASTSPAHAVQSTAPSLPFPSQQISPKHFLQQRTSPYRPVHNVSTLLYPPPSAAMQNRPSAVDLNQMHYQPLGKLDQHRGRLPYVRQNLWIDGNQPQEMTPIHAWPGMAGMYGQPQQQQPVAPQQ